MAVEDRGDLLDALVEEAERRGVREHQAGSALVDLRAQVVESRLRSVVATFASSKPAIVTLAGLVPCAVSAVTITFRRGSPRSANAARMIISRVSSPCEPAAGWSETAGSPAILGEDLLELPLELERALDAVLLLQRVEVAEAGQGDDALVDARVVLHRAAAERVEAGVDPEVAIGELGEVPHDLVLRHLGQARRTLAAQLLGQFGKREAVRRDATGAPAQASTSRR